MFNFIINFYIDLFKDFINFFKSLGHFLIRLFTYRCTGIDIDDYK